MNQVVTKSILSVVRKRWCMVISLGLGLDMQIGRLVQVLARTSRLATWSIGCDSGSLWNGCLLWLSSATLSWFLFCWHCVCCSQSDGTASGMIPYTTFYVKGLRQLAKFLVQWVLNIAGFPEGLWNQPHGGKKICRGHESHEVFDNWVSAADFQLTFTFYFSLRITSTLVADASVFHILTNQSCGGPCDIPWKDRLECTLVCAFNILHDVLDVSWCPWCLALFSAQAPFYSFKTALPTYLALYTSYGTHQNNDCHSVQSLTLFDPDETGGTSSR